MTGDAGFSDPSTVPKPGDILDWKYRVESVLGAGGMGMVLLVEHLELGQRMAVKVMLPDRVRDTLSVARFLREARAAAGIHSEHVVRIFDVGTLEDGAPYMVMELLRGEDLAHLLARSIALPVQDAVEYVIQACYALGEAHAMGIVHRDLKPSNLFLTRRSDGLPLVKVLDFGISKAMEGGPDSAPRANLTTTRAMMGSPLYMSPEQVRDAKHVDARSDIWALGVLLQELLTGSPAFVADTLPGICAAIIADPPAPLSMLVPDVSTELQAVVWRCLEKKPDLRYQNTAELVAALRPFAPRSVRSGRPVSSDQTMPEAGLPSPSTISGRSGRRPVVAASAETFAAGVRVVNQQPQLASGQDIDTFVSGPLPKGGSSHPPPADSPSGTAAPLASSALRTVESAGVAKSPWAFVALLLGIAAIGIALTIAIRWRTDAPETARVSPAPAAPLDGAGAMRRGFTLLVDSTPSGAEVVEGSDVLGRTPMQISIDNEDARQKARKLMLRLPGYQPYTIVQGASEDNVHILAPLAAGPGEKGEVPSMSAPLPSLLSPPRLGNAALGNAAPLRPGPHGASKLPLPIAANSAVAPPPIAPVPPPAIAAPPSPATDIRLQR